MAEKKLQDPHLPSGEIVATHDDDATLDEGQVRRNDGVVLNPAARNPWYVLATVAGEKETTDPVGPDDDLAVRNRRFWNGWACAGMDENRAALAEKLGLPPEELAPLSEAERETLEAEFARRLRPDVPIPDPSDMIDCMQTHFPHTVLWRKCAFPARADFYSATFSGSASFHSASFSGSANFRSATFSDSTVFRSATFSGGAHFEFATFSRLLKNLAWTGI